MEFQTEHESVIRLSVFAGMLLAMIVVEALAPRRRRVLRRNQRWVANLSLVAIDTMALRVLMPLLAVGAAELAATQGWGALNIIELPYWAGFVVAFILLDLAIYGQHVIMHKIPALWALHRVHHADRDIDATTGLRFHPFEIVLSMAYKIAIVILIGAPAAAVIIFEIILNGAAIFNHANIRLPTSWDKGLRAVIVTPDMHRVHHSAIKAETDRNYGFFLSFWDRLFGTYRAQPRDGHDKMTIGLAEYQTDKPASLWWCLASPFDRMFKSAQRNSR